MFDLDDPLQLKAGLDFLSALKSSSLKARRNTLEIDDDFWQTLSVDALDLMLWSAKHPGNKKGNNTNTDRNDRSRLDWDDHVKQLQELGLFKRYYRMSPGYFEALYELMRDDLQSNEIKANNSTKQGPISARTALSATLRFLAGGSYADIMLSHKMGKTSFYRLVKRTITALNDKPELKLKFPLGDPDRCAAIAQGFVLNIPGGTHIEDAMGAVDGFHAMVKTPRKRRPGDKGDPRRATRQTTSRAGVTNPTRFHNHKGFYSINVQAAVDNEANFTYIATRSAGSVHDSQAWQASDGPHCEGESET